MTILEALTGIVGSAHVLTGSDTAKWSEDWTGKYAWTPLAVVRPATTAEVSAVARQCYAAGHAMVPVGGNTGLTGATSAEGAVMVSLERLNRVRSITVPTRTAKVEAGVILDTLHGAAADHGLMFPLTFGARGSAMVGGFLATNAGGSNVLRYGNTRDLCLGLEIVLPDGRVMDLMSELHKDNTGYNLRHLFIGAEGTLGFITAAVLKLFPEPQQRVTAMLGLEDLGAALPVLNELQGATAGGIEAFEYMPRSFIERHAEKTGVREPFDAPYAENILVEAASSQRAPAGQAPLRDAVEGALAGAMEKGQIADAVIAQSEGQRNEMWARREMAAELTFTGQPIVDTDIAVPLEKVPVFLRDMRERADALDPGAQDFVVSHLGDGNIHYTLYPSRDDPALKDAMVEAIEDVALGLGGSFSAEHGIGLSKKASMARRKDETALALMGGIKAAFDPKGLMNPGKVLP